MRPVISNCFWTFALLLLITVPVCAQTYTLSGYVKAASDGTPLIGATVAVPELNIGTITDQTGFYTLKVTAGKYTLFSSYIGFQNMERSFSISNDRKINLELEPAETQLKEIEIVSNSLRQKLNENRMGVEFIASRDAKLLPALFGEVDLLKVIQLKPGIQSSGEGNSGLYVRGGGSDQNLVLLDDALIYNPSHLLGFFSTFNSDVVKSIELYKGGFPAHFGGRLSSVVDVKLREGDFEKTKVSGGIGAVASRLTVEGPIAKNKVSFILSGRRTYLDVFTRIMNQVKEDDPDYNPIPDYHFYDLNGKLTYKIDRKNELSVSGYYGRDAFSFNDDDFNFRFNWGNKMGNITWKYKFNSRLYARTSASATSYQYNILNSLDVFDFKLTSSIKDLSFKTDFDWLLKHGHNLKFGAMATHHGFTIGRLNFDSNNDNQDFGGGNKFKATEFGVYASDDFQVNSLLSLNYGLRFSGFNSARKTYVALEPRASVKYSLNEDISLKGSYASMMQYVHLVSNSGTSLPTDIWYPSTANVRPQRSQQIALGASKLFSGGKFLLTNEVYYKWMRRQIDIRDGASLFMNDSLENDFLFGKGKSYGNEIYLEKTSGRTTGWLGYTLSWTFRQFDEINGGKRFPTSYDRRHDISLVLMHELNKRVTLTGSFVYGTGSAFSLPMARFAFQDVEGDSPSIIPIYTERNSFRLAAYHRLDLGVVYKLKPKHGESDLTFSMYNAYNRRNPYFVYFEQVKDKETEEITNFRAKQVSLFPVIPSVTYNFKF